MRQRSARTVAVVALAVLVVLAGCGGSAGGGAAVSSEQNLAADGGQSADASATSGGEGGGQSDSDALAVQQRQLIRTGHVVVEVDDYQRARRNLTTTAEQYGGWVSDSTQRRHRVDNATYLTGSVTLRVPSERFEAMMTDAEAVGTVESSETNTRDVTDQLVDIEARLENLRAQRERLRELYQQANDTEAILQVQERLSEVQTEIERLEARQQSLERQVAYSTITVELRESRPDPVPDPVQQWYEVPLVKAFFESVNGVVVTLRALAVIAAYAAPYVLTFAAPPVVLGGGYLAWRRGLLSRP